MYQFTLAAIVFGGVTSLASFLNKRVEPEGRDFGSLFKLNIPIFFKEDS